MKTIYTFDRFSNTGVFLLMLLFIGILLVALIRILPFLYQGFKAVKAFFSKANRRECGHWHFRNFAIMLSFTILAPLVIVSLILGCAHIMYLNECDRVDVSLSSCEIVEGTLDDFSYVEEYYNHGKTLIYRCSFWVAGVHFDEVPISSDLEKTILSDFMSGARFTVYYQTKMDRNLILQMDMHTLESIP